MCGAFDSGTERKNLGDLTDSKQKMKTTQRIICIGNRFRPEDSAGPMVYDYLVKGKLPENVAVIDGGLAGLNLLRFMEGAERVVFVDAVTGFRASGGVIILDAGNAAKNTDSTYGHGSGLAYLLRMFPKMHEGKFPEIFVVGIEGGADPDKITQAAEISLEIMSSGKTNSIHCPCGT